MAIKKKKKKKGKKRGRPKGSKNKKSKKKVLKKIEDIEEYKVPKSYKFLGYCPKCKGMISERDLESRFIFICPCGCRKRTKYLRKAIRGKEKVSSKEEYLKNAIKKSKQIESKHKIETNIPEAKIIHEMEKVEDD